MARVLEDRIALVTGGGQGLGEALSMRMAAEGCHVVVADLNEATATKVATAIRQTTDRRALAIKADVTDEPQVAAMIQLQWLTGMRPCESPAHAKLRD